MGGELGFTFSVEHNEFEELIGQFIPLLVGKLERKEKNTTS